jgi:hypothetical protein
MSFLTALGLTGAVALLAVMALVPLLLDLPMPRRSVRPPA